MTAIVPRQDCPKDDMAAVIPVMEGSVSYSLEKFETSHNSRSGAVMRSLNVAFGGRLDEYAYAWVETLQSFWLRRDDLRTHLVRAVNLCVPEQARTLDGDEVAKLCRPPIMMLYRYLRGDVTGFNESLADALRQHKEYWTADEDRKLIIHGVVAIGPLAIACLAKANGLPVEVESGYLPEALLDFAWRGEFDA